MTQVNDRRRKWIDELTSGKYEQCHGIAQRNDTYCAIGVGFLAAGLEVNNNDYSAIREYYNLTTTETDEIVEMNDWYDMLLPAIGIKLQLAWKLS